MSLEDFMDILRKEKDNNFVFSFGNSTFFSNTTLTVRDDPNFRYYFGDFLLKNKRVYKLGMKKGRIKFLGEEKVRKPNWDVIEKIFRVPEDYEVISVPKKRIEGRFHPRYGKVYIEHACGLSAENGGFVIVNKDYLDYLDSIRYDKMYLSEDSELIQFSKDKKINAVLGLIGVSPKAGTRVATEIELISLLSN